MASPGQRFHDARRLWRPTSQQILWMAAAATLVLLPHVQRVPLWLSASFMLFTLWRVAAVVRGTPLPGAWLRLLLGLAVMLGVVSHFGTLFGRHAGVALLVGLTGLKILEARTLRDAYVVVLLSYFLVITSFLFSQSIFMGAYMLALVVVSTANLVGLNSRADVQDLRQRLGLAATLVLQAVPIMLVVFLLFPRINGPLWGLPKDAHGAISGLSDSMSPGDISQLGQSDQVAFRVDFFGPVPNAKDLYWRGPVLGITDGRRWRLGSSNYQVPAVDYGERAVDYEVTLEAHDRRWLFAMDLPAGAPQKGRLRSDFQIKAYKHVRKRLRYRARSYLDSEVLELRTEQRREGLQLPGGRHPRAIALARRLAAGANSDGEVVRRVLDYIRAGGFRYTLSPPLLPGDPIDDFLFDTRSGFCEHYASAFTVLMRAAGIPSRVVTGYQGGEVSPVGNYLIVRQRDAHAWSEVWLEDRGWVRVDPTAAVSPLRVEQGMNSVIAPRLNPMLELGIEQSDAIARLWDRLRFTWDSVNHRWNLWVLGYGPERQSMFLSRFGIDARDWASLGLYLAGAVAALLLLVGISLYLQNRVLLDPAQHLYRRFCRRLARRGLQRAPGEAPRDFARRAGEVLPEYADRIQSITGLYLRARYALGPTDLDGLRRQVAEFRP